MASQKQVAALLKLGAEERYIHLVRRIADFEEAWSLRSPRGWATLADDSGQLMFPLWPHAEYVAACQMLGDPDETPAPIELKHLLDVLLPRFISDGTMIAAFPTPSGKGVPVPAARLRDDILRECQRYEG